MHRFALVLAAACAALPAAAADLLIHGGPIYTGRDATPTVEAVVVMDRRIAFAGGLAEARQRVPQGAQVIDLKGAAMFPGFTDAHAHLFGIGMREMTLNLEGVGSIAELKEKVGATAAEAGPGGLVYGRGWIETHWPEGRFPTAEDLHEAAPGNPVLLVRADGHAAVLNKKAMELAGITAETEAPFGGEILKDEAGQPTGMLIDAAMDLAADLQPSETEVDRRAAYEKANRVYTSYGWTGLHNMSVEPADVPLIERLAQEGVIALRVYNSVDRKGAGELLAQGPRTAADGRIVTRAVKLYVDGALGSRGAALLEPYADAPGSQGLLLMRKAEILPLLIRALQEGIQINTHAIGDRGNRLVLDWYEEAFATVPAEERAVHPPRWRIEHAQIVAPADIPRFAPLGVIPSMQPSHAIGDLHFAPARLGEKRLEGAYAWRSFIESGAIIAAGSDAPVERGDPLIEFYAAVARMDLEGFQGAGWHPEQAVSRATALKMFTAWPAYAAFAENELGVIQAGKAADFSVFSVDLMAAPVEAIPQGKALMTIVGGEIVYRSEGF